jgi:tRNA-2-methylthio-N6-dimethylallyladenosine synthase
VTLSARMSTPTGSSSATGVAFAKCCAPAGNIEGSGTGPVHLAPSRRTSLTIVIAAMAETAKVMPQLHMPLQSGSDAILRSMRRS